MFISKIYEKLLSIHQKKELQTVESYGFHSLCSSHNI